jgi:hypothetical protein
MIEMGTGKGRKKREKRAQGGKESGRAERWEDQRVREVVRSGEEGGGNERRRHVFSPTGATNRAKTSEPLEN